MLELSYPFLIIIGITALGVALYFNLLLKRILKIFAVLLKMQINNHLNPKEYIYSLGLQLQNIGVAAIVYKLSYSHSTIIHESTLLKGNFLVEKTIQDNLIHGYIGIHVKSNRGEQKILNSLILYIINLQILNHIHSKIHTTNESFKKISQLQTYMVHDLKNILQFFQAMQYNVENIHTDEEKSRFIHHLQNNTEPINRKVKTILALLKVPSNATKGNNFENISIASIFEEYKNYYKLACGIVGDALIFTDKEYIQTIADNILGNIHDKRFEENISTCQVLISQNNTNISLCISDTGAAFENPLEVCEPFYTTKAQGIGIGMYQVASVVELLEGTILCENINGHPQTTITFPFPS